MSNLKGYLMTGVVVLATLIVLKLVKGYLPASIQAWIPVS